MRAALIESFGQTPSVTELPAPGGDAARGTVVAAGLNPVDLHIAGGDYYAVRPKPPYTPGMEGVARRDDGSLVYFGRPADLRHGSLAEQVLLDDADCFELRPGTDPAAAISCGIAGLAAWLSVVERGRIREGDRVLITGATGAAGQLAIQAARIAGASRIVAVGRDEAGLARAQELGATHTLRWHAAMFVHQLELRQLAEDGHDLVIDFTWGAPAVAALLTCAKDARIVQVGNAASAGAGITASDLRARNIELLGFSIFNETPQTRRAAFDTLLAHVESGDIALDVERVPLEAVPDAWAQQAASPGRKFVVEVGEGAA